MNITAIREMFPDEWASVKVTNSNQADGPVAGLVLTHSPDKHAVYQTVKAYLTQHPAARLFTFFTGDPIPRGVEVAFALL